MPLPPSGALSLVDLLAQLAGAELAFQREDDLLAVAILSLPVGRQMLLIERTYRDGIGVLLNPTPEDLDVARTGDLWQLWNSERRLLLASALPLAEVMS